MRSHTEENWRKNPKGFYPIYHENNHFSCTFSQNYYQQVNKKINNPLDYYIKTHKTEFIEAKDE